MSTESVAYNTPGRYSFSPPATLLNGSFVATVYGSPGQGPGADATIGDGFGAKIRGNVPAIPGADSFDLYVADGGPSGWGGPYGRHRGGPGGAGYGNGVNGGWGGSSSAVVRHSDNLTMIEAAGGGGMGGYQSSARAPYIAGNGGSAGNGTGVSGSDGTAGGSVVNGPGVIPPGTAAQTGQPGAGGIPPAGGVGFGQAGTPTGTGAGGRGGPAAGQTDPQGNDGGGGGGGGGFFGGGGGAGGLTGGGGGGGGAGLSVVDPAVILPVFAGYSYSNGLIQLSWVVADPPQAPTILAPANNGYADMAGEVTFTFQYNPAADSGALNTWAFLNVTTGKWWDDATLAWSSTVVWNSGGALTSTTANVYSYTFPHGSFPNGQATQVAVACTESYYNLGTSSPAYSPTISVNGSVAPTVTLTSPTSGASFPTVTPMVSWSEALAATPQSSYRVVAYTAAQAQAAGFAPGTTAAFFDTGVVAGTATSVTVGPLPPGGYEVFVQVADAHGEVNEWGATGSWSDFDVRLTTYPAPTLTATPSTDPDNGVPVAELGLGLTGSPSSFSVQYSDDAGTTWLPLLEATLAPPAATAYDHTIPLNGGTRRYRASANGTTTINGVIYPATSPWSPPASCSVSGHRWSLSDPVAPSGAGSMLLHRLGVQGGSAGNTGLSSSLELDQPEQQGQFLAFGRTKPITVRGDLYDEWISAAGLTLLFQGEAEWLAFNAIRLRRRPVVLRSDMGEVFCVILGAARPATLLRAADRITNPYRVTTTVVTAASLPAAPSA